MITNLYKCFVDSDFIEISHYLVKVRLAVSKAPAAPNSIELNELYTKISNHSAELVFNLNFQFKEIALKMQKKRKKVHEKMLIRRLSLTGRVYGLTCKLFCTLYLIVFH